MSTENLDDYQASAPFEGPEKLLEVWFAPSPSQTPIINGKHGLRAVPRQTWEDMLDIVKCKVLSVIEGIEMDAYLLSESSLFVSPHRIILKTCGTTLNLFGLPRILEIAAQDAQLPSVYRCFYSRKSFMFPERQSGPHRDWKQEVEYLDNIFNNGAAYTIGKVNGDHWLLYLTNPDDSPSDDSSLHHSTINNPTHRHLDYTIEILMSDLSPKARQPFFFSDPIETDTTPASQGADLSDKIGISEIFPSSSTHLDAYAFQPCGYSSNALIKWNHQSLEEFPLSKELNSSNAAHSGEGYYTIHVTPEEGWSYASFECNVPLSTTKVVHDGMIPDLKSLIKRVVSIFEPGRITLTLFVSSEDSENDPEEHTVEAAQREFKTALSEMSDLCSAGKTYKRTDKINYEFGGYDLAFASFELK
ncbi:S-adenosylmethionine decarboxylase [Panaeolus papilionaceus]|nr:S-adenosylmethionine decarboxylase [Panaeolus papilionaceus]